MQFSSISSHVISTSIWLEPARLAFIRLNPNEPWAELESPRTGSGWPSSSRRLIFCLIDQAHIMSIDTLYDLTTCPARHALTRTLLILSCFVELTQRVAYEDLRLCLNETQGRFLGAPYINAYNLFAIARTYYIVVRTEVVSYLPSNRTFGLRVICELGEYYRRMVSRVKTGTLVSH